MPKESLDHIELIYLQPDEPMPDAGDDEPWMVVEPFDDDGKFYSSGGAFKASGEWAGYAPLSEDDVSFGRALAAAKGWAAKYKVSKIYVRKVPFS